MMDRHKKYSDVFASSTQQLSSSPDVDADVIVVGAGIAGSSIAHWCASTDENCRIILLEQHEYEKVASSSTTAAQQQTIYGSSRGGPRRIGTIGGDERVRNAWQAWQDMNNSSRDKHLLDVTGEVYVFAAFPFGWLFMVLTITWFTYNRIFLRKNAVPEGFQFLWKPSMIQEKLGNRQGFQTGCWKGCIGMYYKEAAALHTREILEHLLCTTKFDNYSVRFGSQVTNIELQDTAAKGKSTSKIVKVSVAPKEGSGYQLQCHHLVIAGGGWTGELLKICFQTNQQSRAVYDPNNIQTKIEVFTCPIYKVTTDQDPPPFTIASGCPIFSCVNKSVYGFPINHEHHTKTNDEDSSLNLAIRPFYKAFESNDPNDQRFSDEQKSSIDAFVENCLVGGDEEKVVVSYSHSYTCRYPKLSLDGGKSFKPVFDYVPGSNQQIVVLAGLDGYSFKLGSVFGREFIDLLNTGKGPKGCEWPLKNNTKEEVGGSFFGRAFRSVFFKLAHHVFTRKQDSAEADGSKEE